MKKTILSLLVAVGLIGSSSAVTLVQYSCYGGDNTPTFSDANISASAITVNSPARSGMFLASQRGDFLDSGLGGQNNSAPNGSISFSFTIESLSNPISLNSISFDHYEDYFNNNGGYPEINLQLQQGSNNPVTLSTISGNYPPYYWTGLHHWDTFSLPLTLEPISKPLTFTIFEGNAGWYGSPSVHLQNISISGDIIASVPEPSTYALFGIGAIGVLMVLRRKKAA